MTIAIDELVGIDELERAAVEFARTAPAVLIGDGVNALVAELLDEVCGLSGLPIDDEAQIVAPFACPGCGSMQGFRRRGSQVRERKLTSLVGEVALVSRMVHCRSCDRRFSPLGQLLGLAPRQRRTEGLAKATAGLAVEVAYAKASRFLSELAGVEVSARTVRRDLIAAAPEAITPRGEITSVPVRLFDGTGERAGPTKGGVALNLAIGIVWRKTMSGRRTCGVELLAATLGESWPALFESVAHLDAGLIVVDCEEELTALDQQHFPAVPRQRCLWHLNRALGRMMRFTQTTTCTFAPTRAPKPPTTAELRPKGPQKWVAPNPTRYRAANASNSSHRYFRLGRFANQRRCGL